MSNTRASVQATFGRECSAGGYRRLARPGGLVTFPAKIEQSDLMISAARRAPVEALTLLGEARRQVLERIAREPCFRTALEPLPPDPKAEPVVAAMLEASRAAGVGPMAAVAGAIGEFVGRRLVGRGEDIIVENGGDVFLRSSRSREFTILAENTGLAGLRVVLAPAPAGVGLATSAGTLGHSLSFGRADAVTILAANAALADALATAIGNVVRAAADVAPALENARRLGALGAVVIADGHLGAWGALRFAE